MISIMLHGFATGLLLQMAIGPVFFFILNLSLQKTVVDGLIAVLAVTIVDYFFITLAVVGVGRLLEKPKTKLIVGILSSLVLILFGTIMMISVNQSEVVTIAAVSMGSGYLSSFLSTFFLTLSSPLTIVFWTSLFAAKAIEQGYEKKQLLFFGVAAGLATLFFLGFSVLLFSIIKASIPRMLLTIVNLAVGLLLVVYGLLRLMKIVRSAKKDQSGTSLNC